jgi:hypothetical protein
MKPHFVLLALALTGCASTVITPEGAKVSEGMYAYTLAIDAHKEATLAAKETANAAATCDAAVAAGAPAAKPTSDIGQALEALRTIGGLAVCGQRVAGNGNAAAALSVPTYTAPPTFVDRAFQAAPIALGLGNLWAGIRANDKQNETAVLLAAENTKREVGLMTAATGSNERIATGGFTALGGVAASGLTSIQNVATANTGAAAQNAAALAAALAAVASRPTNQVTVGGNYNQAAGDITIDESTTLGDRVLGDGNRLRNLVECTALGGAGAPATAGNNAGTGGATSPLTAGYNPFITGGAGAPATNNCGNG